MTRRVGLAQELKGDPTFRKISILRINIQKKNDVIISKVAENNLLDMRKTTELYALKG